MGTFAEVLAAVDAGELDLGFVGIENSIEGTVNVTIDALALEHDLLIQREVVLGIQLNLLGPARRWRWATSSGSSTFPVAAGQCRAWLQRDSRGRGRGLQLQAAEAARLVGRRPTAAPPPSHRPWPPRSTASTSSATDIEDHPENRDPVRPGRARRHPGAHGPRQDHDRGVPAGRPGRLLLAILQEFAARSINLTKPGVPPTKKQQGDYCFVIDLEGHLADEVVADGLRTLRSKVADIEVPPAATPPPATTAPRSAARPRPPGKRGRHLAREPARKAPHLIGRSVGSPAEWWPSGRRQRSWKAVGPQGLVGSNPTHSAQVGRLARSQEWWPSQVEGASLLRM